MPPPKLTIDKFLAPTTDLSRDLFVEFERVKGNRVSFLTDSYNQLIDDLSSIFTSRDIELAGKRYKVIGVTVRRSEAYKFEGVTTYVTPGYCRISGTNYTADISITMIDEDEFDKEFSFFFGRIPIMLRSKICATVNTDDPIDICREDPGGYYITSGHSRNVLAQEHIITEVDVIYRDRERLGNHILCHVGSITKLISVVIHTRKSKKASDEKLKIDSEVFRVTTGSKGDIEAKNSKSDPGLNLVTVIQALSSIFSITELDPDEEIDMDQYLEIRMRPGLEKETIIDYIGNFIPTYGLKGNPSHDSVYNRVVELLMPTFDESDNNSWFASLIAHDTDLSKKPEDQKYTLNSLETVFDNLRRNLYPHFPIDNESYTDIMERINMLLYMTVRLALARLGYIPYDDRNSNPLKYVQTSPMLMERLISSRWETFCKDIEEKQKSAKTIAYGPPQILAQATLFSGKLEKTLVEGIELGKWYPGNNSKKGAIVEDLIRMSIAAIYGHLTILNTPSNKQGVQANARNCRGDQDFGVCRGHTPDSDSCGLVRHLASMAIVSTRVDKVIVLDYIERFRESGLVSEDKTDNCTHLLIVGGRTIGWCVGKLLHEILLKARQSEFLPQYLGISLTPFSLSLRLTAGRLIVPMLRVDKESGQLWLDKVKPTTLDFNELFRMGVIEYLDLRELVDAVICPSLDEFYRTKHNIEQIKFQINLANEALLDNSLPELPKESQVREALINAGQTPDRNTVLADILGNLEKIYKHNQSLFQFDYVAVDPTALLGVVTAVNPLVNMMQAPRVSYQCSMAGQTVGVAPAGTHYSTEVSTKNLVYGEQSMLYTQQGQRIGYDLIPNTKRVFAGIMPFNGQNQEDAIIFNKSSLERGLFMQQSTHTFNDDNQMDTNFKYVFYKPVFDPKSNRNGGINVFRNLDRDGFPSIGAKIEKGDCVIGKAKIPKKDSANDEHYNNFFKLTAEINALDEQIDELKEEIMKDRDLDQYISEKECLIPVGPSGAPRFAMSQTVVMYNTLLKEHPELLETIKERIKAGERDEYTIQASEAMEALMQVASDKRRELANIPVKPIDVSTYVNLEEQTGSIHNVFIHYSGTYHVVRVVVAHVHKPQAGDKFAPRYGQKMTISKVYPQDMMPYDQKNGVSLDVMINPSCIISRMTANLLVEMLVGKVDTAQGTRTDGTAFRSFNLIDFKEQLAYYGFSEAGTTQLIDPTTGEYIKCEIMVGPIEYQALKHQVEDKQRARGRGDYNPITGLPVRGRRNNGAIQLGVMERDCLMAHGATQVLKERFSVDVHETIWCANCGILVSFAVDKYICTNCKKSNFVRVNIGKTLLFGFQLMMAVGIAPKLIFSEDALQQEGVIKSSDVKLVKFDEKTKDIDEEFIPAALRAYVKKKQEEQGEIIFKETTVDVVTDYMNVNGVFNAGMSAEPSEGVLEEVAEEEFVDFD